MTKQAFIGTGVLVLSLAFLAGPADARRQGPKASVASATACALALDGVDGLGPVLSVTTTLEDRSSGAVSAEVRAGEIEGTYKKKTQPGNVSFSLGVADIADLVTLPADVDPDLTITAHFPLCEADGSVRQEVIDARELNGKSTISYGISGGAGDARPVMNRCTDDPDTIEDEGAIKVDDATFLEIQDACAALIP